MYEVRDGSRTLQFDGELLAESTSYRPGNDRWVEFQLYRTKSGSYILGRTGQTNLYHDVSCAVVSRNNIRSSSATELLHSSVPCPDCAPDSQCEEVAIEKPRHFALVSESPEAVLEALYKYDASGARYLTLVAQRLVEKAGEVDTRIYQTYKVEYIY